MNKQEIETLLTQHSPDESMREAQLAEVVRELMEEIKNKDKKIDEVLNYCAPNHASMWASVVAGYLLEREFRDASLILKTLNDFKRMNKKCKEG